MYSIIHRSIRASPSYYLDKYHHRFFAGNFSLNFVVSKVFVSIKKSEIFQIYKSLNAKHLYTQKFQILQLAILLQ